jgi:uncharacterized membrane protein YcaP (DUF421 family)
MEHLIGGSGEIGWVAVKALLLYLTAVIGFRLGERRTLAQMSPFDFVAAVAVGAIIGRVPNAEGTSYLVGAATLVTILVAHRAITSLRSVPLIGRLIEHPPRVLVANGEVRDDELRRCGLTRADLSAQLRQQGVGDLGEVGYAIFEQRGQLSIIRRAAGDGPPAGLVREVIDRGGERA